MGGASAPTARACCPGVAHCRRRGLDCSRSRTRGKYRRGKCERLPTPAHPARTGSHHCIGALSVGRHSYLKSMRGDQRVPRFTNTYRPSTQNVWVTFPVPRGPSMETGYWSALYRRPTASLHAPYIRPAVSPRETLNPSELDLAAARQRAARTVGDDDARGGLAPIFTRFFDRLLEGAAA